MKKIILFSFFVFAGLSGNTQAPQSFMYQAVVRNSTGEIIANQPVSIRVSILEGFPPGISVYTERHFLSTNDFGLATLEIGNGQVESGSFDEIHWGGGDFFLSIYIDPTGGTNFILMGTSQLLSVPFALFANNGSEWIKDGDNIHYDDGNVGIGTNSPLSLFHLKGGILSTGTTGTTPMSGSGTRFMWVPSKGALRAGSVAGNYWDDANIGTKSMAIGENNMASGATSISLGKDNQAIGQWSLAFGTNNLSSGLSSIAIGGGNQATNGYSIAMGGSTQATGYSAIAMGDHVYATGNYSRVIGLNSTAQSYGSIVIGRFNLIEGSLDAWVDTDPLFVIGNGLDNNNRNNALMVYKNGNTDIDGNLKISQSFDLPNTSASSTGVISKDGNSFMHNYKPTSVNGNNLFIGNLSGNFTMSGGQTYQASANIGLGSYSLHNLTNGFENVAIGAYAQNLASSAHENTAIGNWALKDNTIGNRNTSLGALSLKANTGSDNTAIGYKAGNNITTGSSNIIIGSNVSAAFAVGSNQLNIGNTIYGDLSDGSVSLGTTFPHEDAIMELSSTTKGFLPPRMTAAQKDAIDNPPEGLIVYNTSHKSLEIFDGTLWNTITYYFNCGTNQVMDPDGNYYNTVQIGNQCWMVGNLKTTKYRNGVSINYPGDDTLAWGNDTEGSYAWYNNELAWKDLYGALYNWYAAMNTNGLCPMGWHVPTEEELTTLANYVGGTSVAGGKLKSNRTFPIEQPRWDAPNTGATDEYGFCALPGGIRWATSGNYSFMGTLGNWWTTTIFGAGYARHLSLSSNSAELNISWSSAHFGFSVRCIKD
jgi:uncharacterized protein (TIGR02145 family)